ncbi:MAG: hypothetical protein KDA92_09195, partial [Planctomycetales bacterium]|nr:hypothetical protein [Planctomycetales bacterium]
MNPWNRRRRIRRAKTTDQQSGNKRSKRLRANGGQLESLEPRMLLAADLDLNGHSLVTLTHVGSEFRLLDAGGATIAQSTSNDGSVVLQGTSGDDTVILDVAQLSTLTLTITGDGSDTLQVSADFDMRLSDGQLTVGATTFTLAESSAGVQSFEHANLTGGNSSNRLTLAGWSGGFSWDGGGGSDALEADVRANNQENSWEIRSADAGYLNQGSFTSVEQLVGGDGGSDVFAFRTVVDDDGLFISTGSLSGSISGRGGDDVLIALDVANTWQVQGTDAGTLNGVSFQSIENLIGGNTVDTFVFANNATISGSVSGGDADASAVSPEIQASGDYATIVSPANDTLDFSAYTGPVTFALQNQVVNGIVTYTNIDNVVGSASNSDQILGPDADYVTWNLTGDGDGEVAGVHFSGFEQYTGADDNTDAFVIATPSTAGPTIVLDGGTGGSDAVLVVQSTPLVVEPILLSPVPTGGTTTHFTNLSLNYSNIAPLSGGVFGAADVVIEGYAFDDTITVSRDPSNSSALRVSYEYETISGQAGMLIYDPITDTQTAAETLLTPTSSLTINGNSGDDTIIIESLSDNFAADLFIYGNYGDDDGIPVDDTDADSVQFGDGTSGGTIDTGGGLLEVYADVVTVSDDVTIDTGASDILFRPRIMSNAQLENLSPLLFPNREVSIDIGANATLRGGSIYLITQSQDISLAETLGASQEVDNFVIGPIADKIESLLALPVKFMYKRNTATITLNEGVVIEGDGTVGIYSTAASDASGVASSSLFSIGYVQAHATATVDIKDNVHITATDAVVITASGDSTASIDTSTDRDVDSTPNPGGTQFAMSLAIANAQLDSTIDVAQTATITAGKSANIAASGNVDSSAGAEAGIFSDGASAVAVGLEFSDANITTTVNGTVIANANPGYFVKFEIDPLVEAADYESTETITKTLVAGDTVKVVSAYDSGIGNPLPAGTIVQYLGADVPQPVNLTTMVFDDATLWQPVSEPAGFVDYENDLINIGPHELVTEDTFTYTNRRGTSIGGLVDGRTYFVIAQEDDPATPGRDESEWVKLAENELRAIQAAYGIDGKTVNLEPSVLGTSADNNKHSFTSDNVDLSTSSVTLPRNGDTVFNAFELGQAVVYHEVAGGGIGGLVDGNTYYVVASTNQTNLQGDTRFTSAQVIQLAESENEARGGVFIELTSVAADSSFRLDAKHVFDTGWSTGLGVVAELEAADAASAAAGLQSNDPDNSLYEKFQEKVSTNAFDKILQGLTKDYR